MLKYTKPKKTNKCKANEANVDRSIKISSRSAKVNLFTQIRPKVKIIIIIIIIIIIVVVVVVINLEDSNL